MCLSQGHIQGSIRKACVACKHHRVNAPMLCAYTESLENYVVQQSCSCDLASTCAYVMTTHPQPGLIDHRHSRLKPTIMISPNPNSQPPRFCALELEPTAPRGSSPPANKGKGQFAAVKAQCTHTAALYYITRHLAKAKGDAVRFNSCPFVIHHTRKERQDAAQALAGRRLAGHASCRGTLLGQAWEASLLEEAHRRQAGSGGRTAVGLACV